MPKKTREARRPLAQIMAEVQAETNNPAHHFFLTKSPGNPALHGVLEWIIARGGTTEPDGAGGFRGDVPSRHRDPIKNRNGRNGFCTLLYRYLAPSGSIETMTPRRTTVEDRRRTQAGPNVPIRVTVIENHTSVDEFARHVLNLPKRKSRGGM